VDRYKPLKFPSTLHDFPSKHYKYLPNFDAKLDKLSVEKYIEDFKHFTDLFEVEHDNFYMTTFYQSLKGDTKEWFRNLHLESISSWNKMRDVFMKFWGERKHHNQYLSDLYSMKKQKDDTVSMFNRRYFNFYHNIPRDIQPSEATTRLYYPTTFHPSLSFILMERKYLTLQQMFIDAQEIKENMKVYGRLSNHVLDDILNEGEEEL